MRVSTIVFIAIFLGLFGHLRHGTRHAAQPAQSIERRSGSSEMIRLRRDLEQELSHVERRCGEAECAVRSLGQAARNLESLIQNTEQEIARRGYLGELARRARAASLDEMRAQLQDVIDGQEVLQAERATLLSRKAVLRAEIELARAGVMPGRRHHGHPVAADADKPSPVDALEDATAMIVLR